MTTSFKIVLAIVFAIGALVFGRLFLKSYNEFGARAGSRADVEIAETKSPAAAAAEEPSSQPTPPATTTPAPTNAVPALPEAQQEGSDTNAPSIAPSSQHKPAPAADASKKPPGPSTSKSKPPTTPPAKPNPSSAKTAPPQSSNLGLDVALFFACLLGFGILAGHGISAYLGQRTVKTIYNDEGEGMSDPEYEQAEQEWANGNHLDAIRLMRDYLAKNPREQHVALRIAEIYEKDLRNPLASALEYEEILTKKLSPERWGWAAIHLCNLYYKLNKPDKALALLRRLDSEYGQTAAAEKARKRLALIESGGDDTAVTDEPSSLS